jgi:hypothetical protein
VTRRPRPALGHLMKNAILGAVVLLASACGAYAFPGETPSPTAATGTVTGHVIAIPCGPVQPADSVCAGRPVQGLEIDYAGSQTGRTVTDSKGVYEITLKPGDYIVKLNTYMRVVKGPLKLSVTPGSTIIADYVLDSGIRVPVPQA